MMSGITAVRGFNDILPSETRVWRHIEEQATVLFSSYGFSEIRVPVVEKTGLFSRSIGAATDIVEKEMYTFPDRGGDSLTLRPEGTASIVRAYIEHKLYAAPVQRLYYSGPMFRYERPQKGRYRQFHQLGVEVLGDESPFSDAETIEMLMRLFERLGINGISLQLNSLGCEDAGCRPKYKDGLRDFLLAREESLCENCRRRINLNPLRALDCKNPVCISATQDAPQIIHHLCVGCQTHFELVKEYLNDRGVAFDINPRMVRGLDYYTRTTFEVLASGGGELGSQNAVAAGGRYDSLVEELGGPKTPCFGFAIGMERLVLLINKDTLKDMPLIVFIALGKEAQKTCLGLVRGLRDRGARVVEDFSSGPLKSRMKRADRLGASYAVILGEDELASGALTLKDMSTGAQEKVRLDLLADRLLYRAS